MSSIDRKAHILKRGQTLTMPRHFIFFDTETRPTENPDRSITQSLRLGVGCYYRRPYCRHTEREEWITFYDAETFWDFLLARAAPKQKLWVVSHNLSFDFTIVKAWRHLRQAGYKLKFFHNSGVTSIISVQGRGNSILFIDSLNYFPESLEKIGKRIGLPKLTIDFETADDLEYEMYCSRDVDILLQAIKDFMRFLTGNKISRMTYTIGSTAMAAYLLNSYHHKIYIHNNKEAIDLERDSYRGGRVECFYIGEKTYGNHYLLDVNSLYPFVMAGTLYPAKYRETVGQMGLETLGALFENYSVVAQAYIETPEPVYAVRRDKTIFPIGRFWTTLCTPELKYALLHGHILEIGKAVVYEQADLFSHYVNKFYTLRQDFKSAGVKTYEHICKKLMNTLYGKFGQRGQVWEKIGDCPDEPDRCEIVFDVSGGMRRQIRYLLGEIWELVDYVETFDSFPAIASHVTAYARMYLWSLMQQCGDGNYFYVDTDSLIVNEKGLENLKCQTNSYALGGLKVVSTIRHLDIRGLKDYSIDQKDVIKGVRLNAIKVNEHTFEQEVWPSLKGILNTGDVDTYTIKKQTKVLNRKYTKGVVEDDGTVTPLYLAESVCALRLF